jgi:PAS domain S-box-containing protein
VAVCFLNPSVRARKVPWRGWLLLLLLGGGFGWGTAVVAAEPPGATGAVLTNLSAVRSLSVAAAGENPAVSVEGVATWVDRIAHGLFLDDGQTAVWVDGLSPGGLPPNLALGSRVRAVGIAHAGFFTPAVSSSNLTVLGQTALPPARLARAWEQRLGRWDGLRVSVEGTLFATRDASGKLEHRVLSDGVAIALVGLGPAPATFAAAPRRVRVIGVSSLAISERREPLDCSLLVADWGQVQFLVPDPAPPALVPAASLAQATNASWLDRLIAVDGVVTWHGADRFTLQDASGGLMVQVTNAPPPAVRTRARVVGGARRLGEEIELVATEFSPMAGVVAWPEAKPVKDGEPLADIRLDGLRVELTGRLVHRRRQGRHEEWLLVRPERPEHFRAVLPSDQDLSALAALEVDSTVRVKGVLQRELDSAGRATDSLVLVATADDLKLVSAPPLSRRSGLALMGITAAALLGSLVGGAWWWHTLRMGRARQQQLEAENRHQSRFALIAATASDQIVTLNYRGHITFINPVGERLLARADDSVLGQPYARWVAPEFRAAWMAAVAAAAAGQELKPFDVEVERADGARREVEVLLRRLGEAELQCIGRDLTDSRRAQRELARQELQLRTIVDSMAEGIVVIDAGRTVVSLNPAAEKILGVGRASLLGTVLPPDWDCTLPDGTRLEPEAYPIIRTLRTGEGFDAFQFSFLGGDGQRRWLSVNSRVLSRDGAGAPQQVIATFTDITARRTAEQQQQQLEEQLRRSETLRALGTLAGGVAHDFNNLLACILGNADLSLAELPPEHPVAENCHEIATAARRGADLVRRILSFSRPQTTRRDTLLLSSVVEEAAQVASKVMPPGVRFQRRIVPDERPIHGDRTQWHQVLVNLCTNAAHALEDRGGDLAIEVASAEISAAEATTLPPLKAGPAVRLTVRDTGCGMDAATLARVFEPFFSTKGPGRGTGLGMAIVNSVVQAHDGRIIIESVPGQGTRVEVLLPAAGIDSTSNVAAGRLDEPPRGLGERVLAVDDDPSVLRLIERLLRQLGYEVTAVGSPLVAMERLRQQPGHFRLLLTDLSMPEQSGVDLALNVRAELPGLPIVIVTGYGPTADQQLARSGGQFPVLNKPLDLPELARTLRRQLDMTAPVTGV